MSEQEQGLSAEGQARRRFLKQAGTVAWASPFIVTMMSRAAKAQPLPGALCGDIGLGDTECNVTAPCGSPESCLPDPSSPGDCACFENVEPPVDP